MLLLVAIGCFLFLFVGVKAAIDCEGGAEEEFEEDRAGMMGDKADGANSLDELSPRK